MGTRRLTVTFDGNALAELKALIERYNAANPHGKTNQGEVINQALLQWLPEFRREVERVEKRYAQ